MKRDKFCVNQKVVYHVGMTKDNFYSSRHTATIFGVALETIRNWADEFQAYLAPSATPGHGKHRAYSYEDLQVFSLVAELKKQGMTYAEVHAALQNGQRGNPPALPPEDVQALVVGEQERRLSVEVEYLQRSLMRAQEDLKEARIALQALDQIKEEKIRLETRLQDEQRRVEDKEQLIRELKDDLGRAQQRIEELLRESGQQYSKGLLDALERRGDLPKKEL